MDDWYAFRVFGTSSTYIGLMFYITSGISNGARYSLDFAIRSSDDFKVRLNYNNGTTWTSVWSFK